MVFLNALTESILSRVGVLPYDLVAFLRPMSRPRHESALPIQNLGCMSHPRCNTSLMAAFWFAYAGLLTSGTAEPRTYFSGVCSV